VSVLSAYSDELPSALETINVPSYILDTAGVVQWVNEAARRRTGDVRGRKFASIVAHEDRRRSLDLFASKVAGTASVTDDEFVLLDADGNRAAVKLSSVPLVRGDRVVGVFGQITYEREGLTPAPDLRLTPRQLEVLRMLERGRSTRQIAHDLHLSPETVRNHVRHVLRALGVHSRLEAVALAREDQHPAERRTSNRR
jgi:PAS domain S-box-containing protein